MSANAGVWDVNLNNKWLRTNYGKRSCWARSVVCTYNSLLFPSVSSLSAIFKSRTCQEFPFISNTFFCESVTLFSCLWDLVVKARLRDFVVVHLLQGLSIDCLRPAKTCYCQLTNEALKANFHTPSFSSTWRCSATAARSKNMTPVILRTRPNLQQTVICWTPIMEATFWLCIWK